MELRCPRPAGHRHDPRDTVVYYGYDERGQRTELTVLGQGTVYYTYNEVGRMTSVLDGKTEMETTYKYDPAGRVTVQAHTNGATTYFSYDLSGRLSEKVTVKNADTSVLVRFAYTRDAAGNPISIERESGLGVYYYEYDALQRLAYEGQFVDAARSADRAPFGTLRGTARSVADSTATPNAVLGVLHASARRLLAPNAPLEREMNAPHACRSPSSIKCQPSTINCLSGFPGQ